MKNKVDQLLKEVLKLELEVKDLNSIYVSGIYNLKEHFGRNNYEVDMYPFEDQMEVVIHNIFKYLDHIVSMIDDSY